MRQVWKLTRSTPLRADAVPKKRGPKTDVLEALLKRVDGLEAKLKGKKEQSGLRTSEITAPAPEEASSSAAAEPTATENPASAEDDETKSQSLIDTARAVDLTESAVYTPTSSRYATLYTRMTAGVSRTTDIYNSSTALHPPRAFNLMLFSTPTSLDFMPSHSTFSMSRPFGRGYS